jgi:uncharacterized protein with von Willebrand factor type A (vWA) domain
VTGTEAPASAALLRGVDRAAFAVSLSTRLRGAGVDAGIPGMHTFARALKAQPPDSLAALYWLARISLTCRQSDLAAFDAVFAAVFASAGPALDPAARRQPLAQTSVADAFAPMPGSAHGLQDGGGLPWATLPAGVHSPADDDTGIGVPQRMPSSLTAIAQTPFEELDASELERLGAWLEATLTRWPTRRTRRLTRRAHGRHIGIRQTMARARRSGWEPIELVRSSPSRRPRRVVMLCDVSQSMQAYANAYLHLMRAAVLTADAEVFAFATSLTRLTAVLQHRSVAVAIEQATETVTDRFGGTRIATNLDALMRSRHGGLLRGAVVIIASDGWDSDDPEQLGKAMSRLHRRAHRVVWMNPRVAAPGFAPLVGAMAAALPYCDELLPAHHLGALGEALDAVTRS